MITTWHLFAFLLFLAAAAAAIVVALVPDSRRSDPVRRRTQRRAKNEGDSEGSTAEKGERLVDFAKHMRKVHFALLTAATVLTVVKLGEPSVRSDRALEDLRGIERLVGERDFFESGWMLRRIMREVDRETLRRNLDRERARTVIVSGIERGVVTCYELQTLFWIAPFSEDVERVPTFEDDRFADIEPWGAYDLLHSSWRPETLEDWSDLWTTLALVGDTVAVVEEVDWESARVYKRRLELVDPNEFEGSEPMVAHDTSISWTDCEPKGGESYSRLRVFPTWERRGVKSGWTHALVGTLTSIEMEQYGRAYLVSSIHVPVRVSEVYVDFQKELAARVGLAWRRGTFEETFPDLSELTEDLRSLPVDQVAILLSRLGELEAPGLETFEVGGLDIPASQLSLWGTLIVLALQLYLLLHLDAYLSAGGSLKAVTVPWIALYTSPLARFSTAATLYLFPMGAVTLHAGNTGLRPWFIGMALILLSALLGAAMLKKLGFFSSLGGERGSDPLS